MQFAQAPSTDTAWQQPQPKQLIWKQAESSQPSDTLLQGATKQAHFQQGHYQQGHLQQGQFQQGQFQRDHIHQSYASGTASIVDEEDDYCQTYAVLVDDLKKLLGQLVARPSSPELQLELQNQTRAAVSGCILFSLAGCCLYGRHLVLSFVPAAFRCLSQGM